MRLMPPSMRTFRMLLWNLECHSRFPTQCTFKLVQTTYRNMSAYLFGRMNGYTSLLPLASLLDYPSTQSSVFFFLIVLILGGTPMYIETALATALSRSTKPSIQQTGSLQSVLQESISIAYS